MGLLLKWLVGESYVPIKPNASSIIRDVLWSCKIFKSAFFNHQEIERDFHFLVFKFSLSDAES